MTAPNPNRLRAVVEIPAPAGLEAMKRTEDERLALGAMLISNPARGLVALSVEDFTGLERKAVFQAISRLASDLAAGEALDAPAVVEALKVSRALDGVGLKPSVIVAELMGSAVTGDLTPARIRRLKDATARRRAVDLLDQAGMRARDDGASLPAMLEELETGAREIREAAFRDANPFLAGPKTAAELMATPLEPPPFLVQDILSTGTDQDGGTVAILAGQAGTGKTWAALQLARAVGTPEGSDFFGLKTSPARVALVLLETPAWVAQERLRAIGGGAWLQAVVLRTAGDLGASTLDLCDPVTREHLAQWVKAEGVKLLVLDPLSYVHKLDENTAADAVALVAALKELARETGAAVLALHHERKGSPDGSRSSDLDALRGSSALSAGVGLVMRLAEKSGRLCLSFPKVQSGKQPAPIYLARTDAGPLGVTDAPEATTEIKARNKAALLDLLADGKTRDLGAIVEAMKERGCTVGERTWKNYLKELLTTREVLKSGRGMYQKPPEGEGKGLDFPDPFLS